MSKIGRAPISIPNGVTVTVNGSVVTVKGTRGELSFNLPRTVEASVSDNILVVSRKSDSKLSKSVHGTARATLANFVFGVSQGFKKSLELIGTGYRARLAGTTLVMSLGFSHEVQYNPPAGITIQVEGTNLVHIEGISKHLVGQVASDLRSYKKPEPYKGKGIKYVGEVVRRKAGKATKTASA